MGINLKHEIDCELLLVKVRGLLVVDLAHKIDSYRAGYSLEARRDIERRLVSGEILCIVATNALELGINIGSLDLSLHCGMPLSGHAGYVQQSGRVY